MTTPTHGDLQRDLGRVEGSLAAMESRMDKLESIVTEGFADIKKELAEDRKSSAALLDAMKSRLDLLENSKAMHQGIWTASQKFLAAIGAVVLLVISTAIGVVFNHWFPSK